MSPRRALSSRIGWMSAAVVVAVAAVLTGTMLASAAPTLPRRTPAQLLTDLQHAKMPASFSGVITENANLGLPSLPNVAGLNSSTLSALSWITGTHTVDIWSGGPRQLRVAIPVSFGETDLRVNGNQVWLWDSRTQVATHYLLPAHPKAARVRAGTHFRASPLTPQQVATKILAAIGPTTSVTVPGSVQVAGRSAYQLQIEPRSSQSLIDRVVIAVDSKTYVPLQLQVFARGGSSPAFSLGFTSLSLAKPAGSNFTFSPPAGAHVKTERVPRIFPRLWRGPVASSNSVPIGVPGMRDAHSTRFPAKSPAKLHLKFHKMVSMNPATGKWHSKLRPVPVPGGIMAGRPVGALAGSGVQVLGSGWLSVAVLPESPALAGAGVHFGWSGGPAKLPGSVRVVRPPKPSTSSAYSSRLVIRGSRPIPEFGQIGGLLHTLLNAATKVSGNWGSGRLLRTSLFSVLITNQGKVLIGAVTPAVLYADAAKVK